MAFNAKRTIWILTGSRCERHRPLHCLLDLPGTSLLIFRQFLGPYFATASRSISSCWNFKTKTKVRCTPFPICICICMYVYACVLVPVNSSHCCSFFFFFGVCMCVFGRNNPFARKRKEENLPPPTHPHKWMRQEKNKSPLQSKDLVFGVRHASAVCCSFSPWDGHVRVSRRNVLGIAFRIHAIQAGLKLARSQRTMAHPPQTLSPPFSPSPTFVLLLEGRRTRAFAAWQVAQVQTQQQQQFLSLLHLVADESEMGISNTCEIPLLVWWRVHLRLLLALFFSLEKQNVTDLICPFSPLIFFHSISCFFWKPLCGSRCIAIFGTFLAPKISSKAIISTPLQKNKIVNAPYYTHRFKVFLKEKLLESGHLLLWVGAIWLP